MNQDQKPSEFEDLKALLAKSLDAGEGEDVPPLPDSLRDRISGQYGKAAAATTAAPKSFFSKLLSLFAQPAWAGAAAAVALLLVAGVLLVNPGSDVIRGGGSGDAPVAIVLYKVDTAAEKAIKESGYFEVKALYVVASEEELRQIGPPKIVVNGSTGQILRFAGKDDPPESTAIPADPGQLADSVAKLLRGLK